LTRAGKILIVDDDDGFRRSTLRSLTHYGYECLEAAGSTEARIALDKEPDVQAVLCDIHMPGRSGIELLRDMTADHPDVAVVMTTGLDDPQMADLAFEIGAFGYVVKPFDTNELLINLASALRRRDLELARRDHVSALEQTIGRARALDGLIAGIDDESSGLPGTNADMVERLSYAISLRDEAGPHIERMSRCSAVLAEAVGFTRLTANDVRLATALHDVGKIGVPDSVLLKPGALSTDERSTMQRHAQIGYQLLAGSKSELVGVAAVIALHHHEWWDGGGYPRGLRGTEIPEEARIAAITDVFDALTRDRVYRAAIDIDEAMAVMSELRGRQFEPRLLDAFLDAMDLIQPIREAYPDSADDDRIRVLLVGDHADITQRLARLSESPPTIKVIGTSATVADARVAAIAYQPDVILMEFELPDGDGADATSQINAILPRAKVVIVTSRTDDHALVRCVAAGCSGFVTRPESIDSLVNAIHAAHAGETVTPASELAPLIRKLQPTQRGLGASLRPREIEVLALVASGLPNKQIAQRLTLSLNTVRNHVQSVLYKLHAHSKLEAVATAVREGIIDYPGKAVGHERDGRQ
jgi:putative two-component system response regulator